MLCGFNVVTKGLMSDVGGEMRCGEARREAMVDVM